MPRPDLQHDLGKKKPFETSAPEAAINVWRTSEALIAGFDLLFKDHGLTTQQYNALRILRSEGRPIPCQSVGPKMINRQSDVTRLLERLERAGLTSQARSTEDRRVVLAHITQKGLDKLARLDQPVRDLHRSQLGHLSQKDLACLSELLGRARSGGA